MIAHTGATPVFADCRREDWLLDIGAVERALTRRSKAIVPVHLYGAPCDMVGLCELAAQHRLAIVEDCAEAFGTRHVGTFGNVGTFSFFGSKTITTGKGGMVITNDDAVAERMRRVKGQGQSPTERYWHEVLGFNYRMTNICAAIGLAQVERADVILARKRALAQRYRQLSATLPVTLPVTLQAPRPDAVSSEWLVSCLLPPNVKRDAVIAAMLRDGIETRPVFHCAHHMPMYRSGLHLPVSEDISGRGISLPSYPGLTDREMDAVLGSLGAAIAAHT